MIVKRTVSLIVAYHEYAVSLVIVVSASVMSAGVTSTETLFVDHEDTLQAVSTAYSL